MENKSIKDIRAFTFFEIMVTLAILSVGIVGIYKGLISCLNYQSHLSRRLYAMNYLDDQINRVQLQFESGQNEPPTHDRQTHEAVINNKRIIFTLDTYFMPYENINGIWKVRADMSWPELGRDFHIARIFLTGAFGPG